MIRAIRSELLKIRTTNAWWGVLLGILAATVLALLYHMYIAHLQLGPQGSIPVDASAEQAQRLRAAEADRYAEAHSAGSLARMAADLYTSGQFFGAMLVMLVGATLVTGEHRHGTGAVTYLAGRTRATVVMAKAVAAGGYGCVAWALTAAVSVPAGVLFFRGEQVTNGLGRREVVVAVLLNLVVFVLWAVLGVGLGALIRSQVGAVATGAAAYLIGPNAAMIGFELLRRLLTDADWVETAQVVIPAIASQVMVTPVKLSPHEADQWVGAAVLLGYGIVAVATGVLATRNRDV